MFFDADPTYVIGATHVVSVEDLTQRSIVFRRLEICHCSTQREAPKTYIYNIYICSTQTLIRLIIYYYHGKQILPPSPVP